MEASPEIFRRVIRWYDRHCRTWVVQTTDTNYNQIGDAAYCFTEREAKDIQNSIRRTSLAFGRVTIEKWKRNRERHEYGQ